MGYVDVNSYRRSDTLVHKGLYKFSILEEKPPIGGHFVLRGSSTAIVERTNGLLETRVIEEELDRPSFLLHVPTLPRMDLRSI